MLSSLYPTKSDFLAKFDQAMQQGIAGEFLLQDDADQLRAEAMSASQAW